MKPYDLHELDEEYEGADVIICDGLWSDRKPHPKGLCPKCRPVYMIDKDRKGHAIN